MLLRGTAIVSALTLLSRVLGLVRDLIVAQILGASLYADAFFVAFRIPNLLRSFIAEGALTSAFVPVFSGSLKEGVAVASRTLQRVSGFILLITLPLTIFGIVFAEEIVGPMAPGFARGPAFELCVALTRIMLPFITCVSFVAMINGALNASGIFGASAWAQVIMNCVLIVGGLVAALTNPEQATYILSVSVLIGGVLQVLVQAPALKRAGFSLMPRWEFRHPEIRSLVKLMAPATIGASVYQLTIFLNTLLASLLIEGSVSWLFYADRVAQFPVGIFTVALSSVLLPALSKAESSKNSESFHRSLNDSLRYTTAIMIPLSVLLWFCAYPAVRILFQRGAFTADSTMMTALAVQALALGLWATSCYSMIARAFIAKRDTLTPTVIGVMSLCVTLLVSHIFLDLPEMLRGTTPRPTALFNIPGHVALALASSAGAFSSFLIALLVFVIKNRSFSIKPFATCVFKCFGAAGLMVAVITVADKYVATFGGAAVGGSVVQISIISLIGGSCYLLSAAAFRLSELYEVINLGKKIGATKFRRANY